MQTIGRLVKIIDCGTINGTRKIQVSFQRSDIDVTPKDTSLPVYKQFVKPPFGGAIVVGSDSFKDYANKLGCEATVEGIASKVGSILNLEIEEGEYKGKPQYTVIDFSLSSQDSDIERGVEASGFVLTDDTTIQDIAALGFEADKVKNSDEYQKILNNDDALLF